jgi:small nuclear ribonucleoprotein (snRNP)-like protein
VNLLKIFLSLIIWIDVICHENDRSYLDKNISLHLNKGRKVSGTLRGYDQFMNIVLDEATDETPSSTNTSRDNRIGMVVRFDITTTCFMLH